MDPQTCQNLTSRGNNFNNFPENQLTKFRAFRDSGRDSVAIDDERLAYIQFVPRAGSCIMHARVHGSPVIGWSTHARACT